MTLRKVLWEADQADEALGMADVQVAAIIAVHGASVPWGRLLVDGVTFASARRVPHLLQALRRSSDLSESPGWPTGPGCASAPPPDSHCGRLSKPDGSSC
jgi:hypothetical protein